MRKDNIKKENFIEENKKNFVIGSIENIVSTINKSLYKKNSSSLDVLKFLNKANKEFAKITKFENKHANKVELVNYYFINQKNQFNILRKVNQSSKYLNTLLKIEKENKINISPEQKLDINNLKTFLNSHNTKNILNTKAHTSLNERFSFIIEFASLYYQAFNKLQLEQIKHLEKELQNMPNVRSGILASEEKISQNAITVSKVSNSENNIVDFYKTFDMEKGLNQINTSHYKQSVETMQNENQLQTSKESKINYKHQALKEKISQNAITVSKVSNSENNIVDFYKTFDMEKGLNQINTSHYKQSVETMQNENQLQTSKESKINIPELNYKNQTSTKKDSNKIDSKINFFNELYNKQPNKKTKLQNQKNVHYLITNQGTVNGFLVLLSDDSNKYQSKMIGKYLNQEIEILNTNKTDKVFKYKTSTNDEGIISKNYQVNYATWREIPESIKIEIQAFLKKETKSNNQIPARL
jgi:hypothetical protein